MLRKIFVKVVLRKGKVVRRFQQNVYIMLPIMKHLSAFTRIIIELVNGLTDKQQRSIVLSF